MRALLDLRWIRGNPDTLRAALARRGQEAPVDRLLELDEARRRLLIEVEERRALRNQVSEEVGRRKRVGEDTAAAVDEMRAVGEAIRRLEERLREVDQEIEEILLRIPNVPHSSVPPGHSAAENVEVRRWGEPRTFSFTPAPHWELGERLGILDFERAARVTGARFVFFSGAGARLLRALANFMLDLHTGEHGYKELFPPHLVSRASMVGTGQLPRFSEESFHTAGSEYWLIPTAEVPVTNFHRGEILAGDRLPLKYVAYSSCFRAEAGAHGRDTRGLIRMHEFEKVELVKFTLPETSYEALESLVRDAEAVLQRLELPYRVMLLCAGDLGFGSAKTYDLEVWMPSYGGYVEISSCSNFEDFQARRAGIRFRPAGGGKPRFVHTLNGSGLAIGRTVAALLENFQDQEGNVSIPAALRPYMGGMEVIRPEG